MVTVLFFWIIEESAFSIVLGKVEDLYINDYWAILTNTI